MNLKKKSDDKQSKTEKLIFEINTKIEHLKTQYNLYFAGEIRIPPETERERIEGMIKQVMMSEYKAPRINLMVQNLSSSFMVYNNMWKKRLNEVETGLVKIEKKKSSQMVDVKPPSKPEEKTIDISLNSEDSFEKFYETYTSLAKKKSNNEKQKETVINSMKGKLIALNIIDAKVGISVEKGKLKLKIKQ